MELFEEQGFEETTAVQIAKRAQVTTRTFFRYFSDKEEVLFADADTLSAALVQQISQAADAEEPLQEVTRTLAGFDWRSLGSRESQRRREAMIASNPALLERDLIKQDHMADEISNALRRAGNRPGRRRTRLAYGDPGLPYRIPAVAGSCRRRRPGNDDRSRPVPARHDRARRKVYAFAGVTPLPPASADGSSDRFTAHQGPQG